MDFNRFLLWFAGDIPEEYGGKILARSNKELRASLVRFEEGATQLRREIEQSGE